MQITNQKSAKRAIAFAKKCGGYGAALVAAACTHTYPESPRVVFDYDHCITHATDAEECNVELKEAE